MDFRCWRTDCPKGNTNHATCMFISKLYKLSSVLFIWYSCVCASLIWFFNYSQQDATIFDYLFLKGSTCFGRFLRPSSGAYNCTLNFGYCQAIVLQAGIDTSLQQQDWLTIPKAECTVMCSWWRAEEPPETCRAF